MEEKIDFVIIWVDGNDIAWQKEKEKYQPVKDADNREIRYRDWDNLQYWFRAVEKFSPWVNKIHFVTWGHLPKWLNTENPKLHIVNHKDYIPERYLPTFSANTIELNLHRIDGLTEQFVYFNDDMFLTNKVSPKDFFCQGLPCDSAILNVHISERRLKSHVEVADMDIINDYFQKNTSIKANLWKWFNYKYGKEIIKNFLLMPWKMFPGFYHRHLPSSFCKKTFEEVWRKEYHTLDETCSNRFRRMLDVNQWLMEDWQIADGNFYPRKTNIGKSVALVSEKEEQAKQSNAWVFDCLRAQKYKMMCINDMVEGDDFESIKERLNSCFNEILPEKSSFER